MYNYNDLDLEFLEWNFVDILRILRVQRVFANRWFLIHQRMYSVEKSIFL